MIIRKVHEKLLKATFTQDYDPTAARPMIKHYHNMALHINQTYIHVIHHGHKVV